MESDPAREWFEPRRKPPSLAKVPRKTGIAKVRASRCAPNHARRGNEKRGYEKHKERKKEWLN